MLGIFSKVYHSSKQVFWHPMLSSYDNSPISVNSPKTTDTFSKNSYK